MNIRKWFDKRGFRFVIQRAAILLDRYGITPAKATARIEDGLATLASYGCAPTFFTPGIITKRYLRFIQGLQVKGAEIAVHSYQHVDLSSLPLAEAREQLNRAIHTFNTHGIEVRGFRCPYLSYSEELLESLPAGLFDYSSNRAISLDVPQRAENNQQSVVFNTLRQFYKPQSSAQTVCIPGARSNMIEIPVCVPDDLQMHDGLGLDSEGISQGWIAMLHQTHRRGELFNLIFHPELGSICNRSFEALLQQAARLKPFVWIARLRDISDWWREKTSFAMQVTSTSTHLRLRFTCSPRATILVRGLNTSNLGQEWDATYSRLNSRFLEVPSHPRPFVGLAPNMPERVASFLEEQGYIVDASEDAIQCGTYIDSAVLAKLSNDVQLINYIETPRKPLVRYWRWPNGAKSAMSITGDLDAVTLLDYASRLWVV